MTRKPGEAPKKRDGEPLLSRWSRLKKEAKEAGQSPAPPAARPPVDPKAPAPKLPPIDKLTLDSDYRDFFHPKVGDDVRRAALKKLFSNPHFNVMDGLDVYIDDYSKTEPIPAAMMAGLRQAQDILRSAREDTEQRERDELKQQDALRRQAPAQLPEPSASLPAQQSGTGVDRPQAAPAMPDPPGDAGGQGRGVA